MPTPNKKMKHAHAEKILSELQDQIDKPKDCSNGTPVKACPATLGRNPSEKSINVTDTESEPESESLNEPVLPVNSTKSLTFLVYGIVDTLKVIDDAAKVVGQNSFTAKVVTGGNLMIKTTTLATMNKLMDHFKGLKYELRSNLEQGEPKFIVYIKGLPTKTPITWVSSNLQKLGFHTQNVINVTPKENGQKTDSYKVELRTIHNNFSTIDETYEKFFNNYAQRLSQHFNIEAKKIIASPYIPFRLAKSRPR